MKVSREQFAANRLRILEEASRLFRDRGFESVKLADVMQAAGMTHGGFYGHFQSKDDLIEQTLAYRAARERPRVELERYVESYLSNRHLLNRADGCDIAGMGPDTLRQGSSARVAMTAMIRAQVDRLEKSMRNAEDPDARSKAIGSWAAMFGAMVLARISTDEELATEILTRTRAAIGRLTDEWDPD